MAETSKPGSDERLQPAAAVLAFVLPGLGHLHLGEKQRGICIMVGVLGLFFGGVFIGGVDVIDSKEDKWPFLAQAPVGPLAFAVDWLHQNKLKANDPPPGASADWFRDNKPNRTKSLSHVNEVGWLYASIAGMLNAICIIDAGWHAPRRRRKDDTPKVVGKMDVA